MALGKTDGATLGAPRCPVKFSACILTIDLAYRSPATLRRRAKPVWSRRFPLLELAHVVARPFRPAVCLGGRPAKVEKLNLSDEEFDFGA